MGYFDYLKWQLSRITTGSRNKCSGKDAKVIEEYNSMKKKQEEPAEQSSSSSSSNTQPAEEIYSPEKKRTLNKEVPEESREVIDENDEDKWPVFEDCHLKDRKEKKELHQLMKWKQERSRSQRSTRRFSKYHYQQKTQNLLKKSSKY